MTTDDAFDSDIRLLLNLGTAGIILGLVSFVWGTKQAYIYAVESGAIGFPAVIGMIAFLVGGMLLTTISTVVCISAVEEQTQIDIICRNVERESDSQPN